MVCTSCGQGNNDPRIRLGTSIGNAGTIIATIGGILSAIGLLLIWEKR